MRAIGRCDPRARCLGSHRTSWHNRDSGRCFTARLRRSQSCSRRSASSVCSPIYVTQRTQEIGIRVAPGAQPGDMVWMIVTHGLKLVASGIAIGIAAAIPLARVMRSMLLGVAPTDMPTFAAATAVLAAVAAAASYISARRQRASTRSQRCGPSELGRSLRSLRALR
ncbi:MAG: hypothetical protein DMG03_09085 [Acidobacteria bacterium]|nr:MAG: hypothetical protein DMG03_09085 [Acidobacteriota bacterium]